MSVQRTLRGRLPKSVWHNVAALSGASAVALGAYGAHGFKPKDATFTDVR